MPLFNPPDFFPRRISQYVPAMRYASDVNMHGGIARISFGAPAVSTAAAQLFAAAHDVSAAGTLLAADMDYTEADAPWGRNVYVDLSGAGTGNVDFYGWDYLGQYMIERVALNGATAVQGLRAFKHMHKIVYPTVGAVTLETGFGTKLGLPYKAIKVISEEQDGAPKGTLGTLADPVLTDPQVITTGDPRDTYIPNTTLNGTRVVTATFLFDNTVNSSNNGGLHGITPYAG